MMTEKENFIQLKKDSILKIGIKDNEGNDTGEHLEFDMEDIMKVERLCRNVTHINHIISSYKYSISCLLHLICR